MWGTGVCFCLSARRRWNPGTEAERRVMTDSQHSLARLAEKWRNPTVREKAVIMGYHPSAVGCSPAPNPARLSDEKKFCDGGSGSR